MMEPGLVEARVKHWLVVLVVANMQRYLLFAPTIVVEEKGTVDFQLVLAVAPGLLRAGALAQWPRQ